MALWKCLPCWRLARHVYMCACTRAHAPVHALLLSVSRVSPARLPHGKVPEKLMGDLRACVCACVCVHVHAQCLNAACLLALQVSEKLMGDECWRSGVDRAVREELGTVLPEGYQVRPGLPSRGHACAGLSMHAQRTPAPSACGQLHHAACPAAAPRLQALWPSPVAAPSPLSPAPQGTSRTCSTEQAPHPFYC